MEGAKLKESKKETPHKPNTAELTRSSIDRTKIVSSAQPRQMEPPGNEFFLIPKDDTIDEFPTLNARTFPSITVEVHTLERDSCCLYWNLGLECSEFLTRNMQCKLRHVCSRDECRGAADSSHRAIQHPPKSLCEGHKERMDGMNHLYPEPLLFHPNSSPEDTREACREYGIRMPSLNADLFEELLSKTTINKKLQRSLVRGWREGSRSWSGIATRGSLC